MDNTRGQHFLKWFLETCTFGRASGLSPTSRRVHWLLWKLFDSLDAAQPRMRWNTIRTALGDVSSMSTATLWNLWATAVDAWGRKCQQRFGANAGTSLGAVRGASLNALAVLVNAHGLMFFVIRVCRLCACVGWDWS